MLYRLNRPESADGKVGKEEEEGKVGNGESKAGNDGSLGKGDGKAGDGKREINNLVITFDENLGREKTGKKIVRYQENPRAEWGPMRKAGGGT